jgi:hypothetical protein
MRVEMSSNSRFPHAGAAYARMAVLWHKLTARIGLRRDHYRPERHYMRGPGPKWQERHQPPR